jgi:phosphoribosylformylglycinamidine (FGAM) synthase PurS component
MQKAVTPAKFGFVISVGRASKKTTKNMAVYAKSLYLILYCLCVSRPSMGTRQKENVDMKKWMTLLTVTLLSFTSINAQAKTKKNDPDKKTVEKILKEVGGEHYVDKMRINQVCSMEMENAAGEEVYYHVYNISLREGGYRIAFFDNTPNYLGFYKSEFEATDYEEGAILLDSGDSDEEGNTSFFTLPVGIAGPASKVRIDGVPTPLVKNPKLDPKANGETGENGGGPIAVPQPKSASGKDIEYRDWKITIQGKERDYNAIFVEKSGATSIKIKDSKRGMTATVPISSLSRDDQAYLKEIGEL